MVIDLVIHFELVWLIIYHVWCLFLLVFSLLVYCFVLFLFCFPLLSLFCFFFTQFVSFGLLVFLRLFQSSATPLEFCWKKKPSQKATSVSLDNAIHQKSTCFNTVRAIICNEVILRFLFVFIILFVFLPHVLYIKRMKLILLFFVFHRPMHLFCKGAICWYIEMNQRQNAPRFECFLYCHVSTKTHFYSIKYQSYQ